MISNATAEVAANNGHEQPTKEDFLQGASTAVVSFGMDKVGLGKLQATKLGQSFASNLVKKMLWEGGTEAGQEALEYTGTHLGTEVGFNKQDAAKSALGGLIGGVGMGAAVGGVSSAIDGTQVRSKRQAARAQAQELGIPTHTPEGTLRSYAELQTDIINKQAMTGEVDIDVLLDANTESLTDVENSAVLDVG